MAFLGYFTQFRIAVLARLLLLYFPLNYNILNLN